MKAFKLGFYVPETHLSQVKEAVFAAGAGRIGNYEHCSWECRGKGQFRPLAGSSPFLGSQGSLEEVEEFRVEMVCEESKIEAVVRALLSSHPYETPAYDLVQLETLSLQA
jgi:hypothetical protein